MRKHSRRSCTVGVQKYNCIVNFASGLSRILSKLMCFDKKVFVLMVQGPGIICYQSSRSFIIILVLFETEVVACICHSRLHQQKPDFEGQSVIKASSYLLPFVLEAHRESLPRSCETSARRLSAESAEVYSTTDLPASAARIPFSKL